MSMTARRSVPCWSRLRARLRRLPAMGRTIGTMSTVRSANVIRMRRWFCRPVRARGRPHGRDPADPARPAPPARRRSRSLPGTFGRVEIAVPRARLATAEAGHAVVKYHDTDVGFLCPLLLSVFLEEDKGPDHDVFAASGVGGRGRVGAGSMEGPARD